MQLTKTEHQAIAQLFNKSNMTVYISHTSENTDKHIASKLAKQFGLRALNKNMSADDNGIISLRVSNIEGGERDIAYSNKAIH